jgi:hypothetical protein
MNKLKITLYIKTIFFLFTLIILQSCSVYKAASNEGVSVSDVMKCTNKGCFLSLGMDIVGHKLNDNKQFVETYRAKARKGGGNYFRAAGHGLLDVATLGLWEVAGTPIEGAMSNNLGYITVIATYQCDTDSGSVKDLDIYDANGKKVELNSKKSNK